MFATMMGRIRSLSIRSQHEDQLNHLFRILLNATRSDPFSVCTAFVLVNTSAEIRVYLFPSVVQQHGLRDQFTPSTLRSLLQQKKWPIAWNFQQLPEFCNLGLLPVGSRLEAARSHERFWVLSQAKQVSHYLRLGLSLIRGFLARYSPLQDHPGSFCVGEALQRAVLGAAEVIAMLTKHCRCGQEALRIRCRLQKLGLVEA